MTAQHIEEPRAAYPRTFPLPDLVPLAEVGKRLDQLFPPSFPDRSILVGELAARVVFIALYGGMIEGQNRYLRPSHVYCFTSKQARQVSDTSRSAWIANANRRGYRPAGTQWYADTSKETIRDDLIRNRLVPMGLMHKRPGLPTTSSTPIYALTTNFAALFSPELRGKTLDDEIERWRSQHLDPAVQQRMKLRAQGINRKKGDVFVELPDGTRMRLSAGPSALIAQGLIETFAPRHLANPAVLWLSASDKKSYPQFVSLAATVGLHIDVKNELPDLILADTARTGRFFFCEIVASDGAVTEERKNALIELVRSSSIPTDNVQFVTAFEDREAPAFRKNFSRLASDSWIWFRTEPELLVELTTSNRANLVPEQVDE
ncbi:MAG: BsuBI/PstI family type II restriction endonuclease [Pseudomarimonas sp.]